MFFFLEIHSLICVKSPKFRHPLVSKLNSLSVDGFIIHFNAISTGLSNENLSFPASCHSVLQPSSAYQSLLSFNCRSS